MVYINKSGKRVTRKFRRCVRKVSRKGVKSPYAICVKALKIKHIKRHKKRK